LGSVSSPAGTVAGNDLSALTDCYTGSWGGILHAVPPSAMAQWNYVAPLLSDKADPCGHEGSGLGFRAGEVTLRLVLVGFAAYPAGAPVFPPAADLPLTLTVGVQATDSGGVHRVLNAYVMKAKNNGGAGTDTTATSGTVTLTAVDPSTGLHEGSYDLWFGAAHATGSFSSPWCGTLPS